MRRTHAFTAAVVLATGALAACASDADDPGGDDAGDDDPMGDTGDASLTFGVTNGVRANPTLADPLTGTIYGNLFLADDVSLTGPDDDATQFGSVELAGVDLEADTATAPWPSPALAPGTYVFLGFFDVDGNGTETQEPDPGDPVTLPVTNQFEIVAGETTTVEAVFDLVLN